MDRREFLVRIGTVLVAVPFVLEAVSCGKDESDRFTVTSDPAAGHTHTITVLCVDVNGSGQVTYTSSATDHSHTVALTPTDLHTIQTGGTVTVTSSTSSGPYGSSHAHDWRIQKPSGKC